MIKIETYNKQHALLKIGDGFWEFWPNHPDKETHRKILENSYLAVVALDHDRIIGFVNVISDGVLTAYIPLLEVLPEYRGQGIATKMLNLVFEKLKNLYMIDTSCDDELIPFYTELGLQRATAMIRRNYARQTGTTTKS